MNVFADLRAKYFTLDRTDAFPAPASPSEPWGVVMEIGYTEAVVTTVAFGDGTVSVLRSSGGGFFGGGDDGVQSAGKAFLRQAQMFQPQMAQTGSFPEPQTGHVVFYLRTGTGIYTASAPERSISEQAHPLFRFYCAGLRILHEYLRLQKQASR
jgi:hypothetical protein